MVLPFDLIIDSTRNVYQLRWLGLLRIQAVILQKDIIFRFKIFFWKKDFYPLHHKEKSAKQKHEKKKKKKKEASWKKVDKSKIMRWVTKSKKILRSFEVREFHLNLDTDSYIWNGYLYPIFFFVDRSHRHLQINYKGDFVFKLWIKTRPYNILKAIIF